MQARKFWQMDHLSDGELAGSLMKLLGSERRHVALVVAHLAEVEDRRLHLKAACSSLFNYAVRRLRFSEGEAFRRVTAARLARRFPTMFELLGSGALHLCAACLLRDYLTPDNHGELLREACGKTKRQIQELLARRFPRPDVRSQIRKLPERTPHSRASAAASPMPVASPVAARLPVPAPLPPAAAARAPLEGPTAVRVAAPSPAGSEANVVELPRNSVLDDSAPGAVDRVRSDVKPLSESRYRIQLNASATLKQKLESARDLTRHSNPSGDLAEVIERAVDLLLGEIGRRRFGNTKRHQRLGTRASRGNLQSAHASEPNLGESRPIADVDAGRARLSAQQGLPERHSDDGAVVGTELREPLRAATAQRSRHIPNACRREVVARDGLGCSYVDAQGNRCDATGFLELHHDTPWARGGANDAANVRLLCRSHNRLLAEQAFGRGHVRAAINRSPVGRSTSTE